MQCEIFGCTNHATHQARNWGVVDEIQLCAKDAYEAAGCGARVIGPDGGDCRIDEEMCELVEF